MSAIERVQQALNSAGIESEVKRLDESAHTAEQAAQALKCDVAQIVKSLIFKTAASNQPVLALVSGNKRLDTNKLSNTLNDKLKKADADFVKATTGFTIGGVAPVGSLNPLPVYMDETLFEHKIVWAADGHPKTIFNITPRELADSAHAVVMDLAS